MIGMNGQGIGTRLDLIWNFSKSISMNSQLKFQSYSLFIQFIHDQLLIKSNLFRYVLSSHSSLSQYVHNVDALSIGDDEREKIDEKIDKIYEDIEKGKCFMYILEFYPYHDLLYALVNTIIYCYNFQLLLLMIISSILYQML